MMLVRHGQSEFNVIYSETRKDPGIEDPAITALGAAQARHAAALLDGHGIERLISSPYRRALQTATIIAETLDLPVSIDPLVREHYGFSCDVGSDRDQLAREWPRLDFSHLERRWWPHDEETDEAVADRGRSFIDTVSDLPDRDQVAVITHWGFIRGTTGLRVTNGTVVRIDRTGRGKVVGIPDP